MANGLRERHVAAYELLVGEREGAEGSEPRAEVAVASAAEGCREGEGQDDRVYEPEEDEKGGETLLQSRARLLSIH